MTDTDTTTPAGTPGVITSSRYTGLGDLVDILRKQRLLQLDIVAPANAMRSRHGIIEVAGTGEAVVTDDGVTTTPGMFAPMAGFDRGLHRQLGVPLAYLQWMRANRPDLYDENVNRLIHGGDRPAGGSYPPLTSRFLLRMFKPEDGQGTGLIRALVTNKYKPIDNLDILMTFLDQVEKARRAQVRTRLGLPDDHPLTPADEAAFTASYDGQPIPGPAGGVDIRNATLTESSMRVRVVFPGQVAHAPRLAANYRSPFRDGTGITRAPGWQPPPDDGRLRDGDLVFGGMDFRNNEEGGGSFDVIPLIQQCICDNGQTVPDRKVRTVHVGARLEEGIVQWSDATRQAAMALVAEKTRDTVDAFMRPEFTQSLVDRLEGIADAPVTDAAATIKVIAAKCQFNEAQQDSILNLFLRGGQDNAAGIANAITAQAQIETDPDTAMDMEYKALIAMETAAAVGARQTAPAQA